MKYKLLHTDYEKSLINRLLEIRNLQWREETFFSPAFSEMWNDPFLLNDMEIWVKTIITAMQNNKKIIIFGDYDVDWITASRMLYELFKIFLHYPKIDIMYPSRQKDGYWLRIWHLDEMKKNGIEVVITVDNGITSIEEAEYANKLGIELIITDHHQPLEKLPNATAVINPLCSAQYPFKHLAGVGVAFKFAIALLSLSTLSNEKKNQIFMYFLPITGIGTVADIMPLKEENRRIVKQWLQLINYEQEKIPKSLKGLLDFLNLKENIDTYHIGFQIAPRINAWGRIASPKDSLQVLLTTWKEQIEYLEKLENINTQRKSMQETMTEKSEKKLDLENHLLISADEDFHEGVIGLIAGRLTEKYNKPSMIGKIDHEKWIVGASLRGPEYFDVMEMLCAHQELLEKFWWHRWAGGLTVKLENFSLLCEKMTTRCQTKIKVEDLEKISIVDTQLFPHERTSENFHLIEQFSPFWEGNTEPTFLLENLLVQEKKIMGKWEKTHLKILVQFGDHHFWLIFRWKGEEIAEVGVNISIIGKIQRDTFYGGRQIVGEQWENIKNIL